MRWVVVNYSQSSLLFTYFDRRTHKECFFNFFFTLTLNNTNRSKRLSTFLLCLIGFETIDFHLFSYTLLWIKLILLKITTRRNADTLVCTGVSWTSTKFQGERTSRSDTGAQKHGNLFLVPHRSSSDTLPLI